MSTDTKLAGEKILKYYHLGFQIEFLTKDAKQFRGLEDCQASDEQKSNFHFNIALGIVTVAKIAYLSTLENKMQIPFSMHNIKQFYYNKFIAENIFFNVRN